MKYFIYTKEETKPYCHNSAFKFQNKFVKHKWLTSKLSLLLLPNCFVPRGLTS